MEEVAIIGGGIFGCVIAKKLQQQGMNIIIIDSNKEKAGSKPAACLMKPSWCSAMGKDAYIQGLSTLESLYDVKTIEFQTKVTKTKVRWINPKSILETKKERYEVEKIIWSDVDQCWDIISVEGDCMRAKKCILACGIWCNEILVRSFIPYVGKLSALTGTAFKAFGQIAVPKISVWMPYKQMCTFNIDNEHIWIGDGTANKDYQDSHLQKSQERCANFLQMDKIFLDPSTGHRPYVKDIHPCHLELHAPNLWVVTGGAKNGTIAAGWAANEISRRII